MGEPKLITCMALREAGERYHDNAGGSRKLSALAAGIRWRLKKGITKKWGRILNRCMIATVNAHELALMHEA